MHRPCRLLITFYVYVPRSCVLAAVWAVGPSTCSNSETLLCAMMTIISRKMENSCIIHPEMHNFHWLLDSDLLRTKVNGPPYTHDLRDLTVMLCNAVLPLCPSKSRNPEAILSVTS